MAIALPGLTLILRRPLRALGPYRDLITLPSVGPMLAGAGVARLPFSINALAVLLFLREATDSYAVAGITAGAMAGGIAVGAPLIARLTDRHGSVLLFYFAIAHGACLVALWALGSTVAIPVLCFAVAFLCGLTFPPCTAILLDRWPDIIKDPSQLRTAYACEAVTLEVAWVAGPLIAALAAALVGPGYALLLSAVLVVVGTATFLGYLPDRQPDRKPPERVGGWMGPLGGGAVRIIAIASLPIGFVGGVIEVVVPAFSHAHGVPEAAGILLAVWAVASAVGGVFYGAAPSMGDVTNRYLLAFATLPVVALILTFAVSVPTMALLLIPAGLPLAPLITTRNEVLHANMLESLNAESFSWAMTTLIVGSGIGSAIAGTVVNSAGWREALLLAVVVSSAGFFYSLMRRSSLQQVPGTG